MRPGENNDTRALCSCSLFCALAAAKNKHHLSDLQEKKAKISAHISNSKQVFPARNVQGRVSGWTAARHVSRVTWVCYVDIKP